MSCEKKVPGWEESGHDGERRAMRPRWRGSARGPRQYKSMYRGIQRHQPCTANGAVGTGSERRYVLSRRSLIQAWPVV